MHRCDLVSSPRSPPLTTRLLDTLQRPCLLPHPRVNNLIPSLDTLWTTLDTLIATASDDDLLLGQLVFSTSTAQDLTDLSGLLSLVEVLRLHHTVGLALGLLNSLGRLELLASLRLGDLLDWPGVQCALALTKSVDGFFGDGDVGLVELGLVVQEP